ncbi:hypothetical protein ACJH6J_11165 [Mycobacterium sp. SMC-18]|uniref:hypothetical protein n=1 Tax=Mycobacteriaceae TaxID=1762 RepID=UPI001BB3EE3E|nr:MULTISPECIES: hypothetical protein [unclassified Mycolicibacterium]BCI82438.1 hypothetical protein MTY66_40630 [Mycolicibacterium sp. TY66]BCJ79916.1 hypothetical protein MTY81_12890 [Mycolicibacterium sp. TY81]
MVKSREPLFDDAHRDDTSVAGFQESTFAFMNRIAGDYWDQPRLMMQQWMDRINDDITCNDLLQRLRSGDDEQFRSAYLELYLHESLLRAGYEIVVHPEVPGTTRHPDFLAVRGDERLYVEAVAPGSTAAAKAAAGRRAVLFDTVNRLQDPNFILWLDHLVDGPRPPKAARLRGKLSQWLRLLDPDAPWTADAAPKYVWREDGWEAGLKAFPKKLEARGLRPDSRAIGIYGQSEASFVDDAPAIQAALAAKHHEYGNLEAPFVIAIGTYIVDGDRWHASNAMYGPLAFEFDPNSDGEPPARAIRQAGGYFGTPPDWQNRNVSGVLVVNQLMPYYFQRAEVTLWRHPSPIHALPDELGIPAHTITLRNGELAVTPPDPSAGEFFGLPASWPPGEAWPKGD